MVARRWSSLRTICPSNQARRLETPEEMEPNFSPPRNTIALTLGYESFSEMFRRVHALWRQQARSCGIDWKE